MRCEESATFVTLCVQTLTGVGFPESRTSGGIGRRACFRYMCLRVWEFKSPLVHLALIKSQGIDSCPLGGVCGLAVSQGRGHVLVAAQLHNLPRVGHLTEPRCKRVP